MARPGRRSGWGGARGAGAALGAPAGGEDSSARRAFPAQGSPRLARPSGRSDCPSPPPPPAPSLAPRAFLGRHLFATRSLVPQVCLGACEHSSAPLSTRLQPARGQHASPPVKRPPPPLCAAISPPSLPPGPADRRHTHALETCSQGVWNQLSGSNQPTRGGRQTAMCIYVGLLTSGSGTRRPSSQRS